MKVFNVVGGCAGKTEIVRRLVAELTGRGLRVSATTSDWIATATGGGSFDGHSHRILVRRRWAFSDLEEGEILML